MSLYRPVSRVHSLAMADSAAARPPGPRAPRDPAASAGPASAGRTWPPACPTGQARGSRDVLEQLALQRRGRGGFHACQQEIDAPLRFERGRLLPARRATRPPRQGLAAADRAWPGRARQRSRCRVRRSTARCAHADRREPRFEPLAQQRRGRRPRAHQSPQSPLCLASAPPSSAHSPATASAATGWFAAACVPAVRSTPAAASPR